MKKKRHAPCPSPRSLCLLRACVPMCLRAFSLRSSDNQGAKWGVSKFGTLRTFEFQPPINDFLGPIQNPGPVLRTLVPTRRPPAPTTSCAFPTFRPVVFCACQLPHS